MPCASHHDFGGRFPLLFGNTAVHRDAERTRRQSEKVDLILPDPPVNVLISNGCGVLSLLRDGDQFSGFSRLIGSPQLACMPVCGVSLDPVATNLANATC